MKMRIAVCALLIACGSKDTGPTKPTGPSGSTSSETEVSKALTCKERVAALRNPSRVEPEAKGALPTVKRWRAFTTAGVTVQLTRRNVVIEGAEISWVDLAKIEKTLAAIGARESKRTKGDTVPLYIQAEPALSAGRLDDIVKMTPRALAARLVIRRETPATPLEATKRPIDAGKWFADWLKQARARSTEMKTATGLRLEELTSELKYMYRSGVKRAIGTKCAELRSVYEHAAKAKPEKRAGIFATGIPDALETCKCNGVDRAYDILLEVMRGKPYVLGWLPLERGVIKQGSAKNVAELLSAKEPAP